MENITENFTKLFKFEVKVRKHIFISNMKKTFNFINLLLLENFVCGTNKDTLSKLRMTRERMGRAVT